MTNSKCVRVCSELQGQITASCFASQQQGAQLTELLEKLERAEVRRTATFGSVTDKRITGSKPSDNNKTRILGCITENRAFTATANAFSHSS